MSDYFFYGRDSQGSMVTGTVRASNMIQAVNYFSGDHPEVAKFCGFKQS